MYARNSANAEFNVAIAEKNRYTLLGQSYRLVWDIRGVEMSISYKKLWKLLIDRDMKKKDLCVAAGISHASMAKLGKNENVTTDVLVKICTALKCDISDIMEMTEMKS